MQDLEFVFTGIAGIFVNWHPQIFSALGCCPCSVWLLIFQQHPAPVFHVAFTLLQHLCLSIQA